jgi:hypothetical protein
MDEDYAWLLLCFLLMLMGLGVSLHAFAGNG